MPRKARKSVAEKIHQQIVDGTHILITRDLWVSTHAAAMRGQATVHDKMHERFPNHPEYTSLTHRELVVHDKKNNEYSGGGEPLGNFNRVAKIMSNYPGLDLADPQVVVMSYIMKHLDAILWNLSKKQLLPDQASRLVDNSIYFKIAALLGQKAIRG